MKNKLAILSLLVTSYVCAQTTAPTCPPVSGSFFSDSFDGLTKTINFPANASIQSGVKGAAAGTFALSLPAAITNEIGPVYYYVLDQRFEVVNNQLQLKSNESIVYNSANATISVMVFAAKQDANQSDDADIAVYQRVTITVQPPVNNQPTDISLSNTTVNKTSAVDSVVGTLSTTDADANDTHTYTIAGGTGQQYFKVQGNQLKVAAALSSLTATQLTITIQSDDNKGGQTSKTFTISVNATRFVKLDANGRALANQSDNAGFHCVLDTGVTPNLIWEVKQTSGAHRANDRFKWRDTQSTNGIGYVGADNTLCFGNDGKSANYCNTEAYVKRVNRRGWCGGSQNSGVGKTWRLPTRAELGELHDPTQSTPPYIISQEHFPNTATKANNPRLSFILYWTSDNDSYQKAWGWLFSNNIPLKGGVNLNIINGDKNYAAFVRLVRTAP